MKPDWEFTIDRFDGLVPGYWLNQYPSFGNRGHASATTSVDLTDPSVLTQGPALTNLANGTEAVALSTLIKGFERLPSNPSIGFAVGGDKLYKLTTTELTNDGTFPHTINKAAVTGEDAESVIEYASAIYYVYNHSGNAGDIGQLTGASTFDDDWGSTVPTGAGTLLNAPHPMILGGNNKLYIGNGRYVASLFGTTLTLQALDLPAGDVVVGLQWDHNRLYIATNSFNYGLPNQNIGSIYIWDTTATSWEYQITIMGRIGTLYVKNGVVYVWYAVQANTGGFRLAYVNGAAVQDLVAYDGSLPAFYQVTEFENNILWVNDDHIAAFGAPDPKLPLKFFDYCDGGHATVGGIATLFGGPYIASGSGGSYRLAYFAGYDTTAAWKSILFELGQAHNNSYLDRIVVYTEPLASGGKLDLTLKGDYGNQSKALTQIAHSAVGAATRHVVLRDSIRVDNFRLDLSWANGSSTNPVKVRRIAASGRFVEDN